MQPSGDGLNEGVGRLENCDSCKSKDQSKGTWLESECFQEGMSVMSQHWAQKGDTLEETHQLCVNLLTMGELDSPEESCGGKKKHTSKEESFKGHPKQPIIICLFDQQQCREIHCI